MKYIVIGLGNYGRVLTEELTERGHEVVCADNSQNRVERVKDKCVTALNIDATDELSLGLLPLQKVDAVIVAIGENLGASIKVVALLKKNNVKHIYARAMDNVHKAILQAFSVDRVLLPEEDSAYSLVRQLDFGSEISTYEIDHETRIFTIPCPKFMVGTDVNSYSLYIDHELKLLSIIKGNIATNCLNIEFYDYEQVQYVGGPYILSDKDKLVLMGKTTNFLKFMRK